MHFFCHPEPVEGTAIERIEPLILCYHYKKVPPEGAGGHL